MKMWQHLLLILLIPSYLGLVSSEGSSSEVTIIPDMDSATSPVHLSSSPENPARSTTSKNHLDYEEKITFKPVHAGEYSSEYLSGKDPQNTHNLDPSDGQNSVQSGMQQPNNSGQAVVRHNYTLTTPIVLIKLESKKISTQPPRHTSSSTTVGPFMNKSVSDNSEHCNETSYDDYEIPIHYYECYLFSNDSLKLCLFDGLLDDFENISEPYSYVQKSLYLPPNYYTIMDLCQLAVHDEFNGESIEPSEFYSIDYDNYISFNTHFVSTCRPLFLNLGICRKSTYLTKCVDGNLTMTFLHDHDCSKSSVNDTYLPHLLAHTLANRDFKCFQDMCNGSYSFSKEFVKGIPVYLIPSHPCTHYLYYNGVLLDKYFTFYYAFNVYWPCCYENHEVMWIQNPELAGLNRDWSYLPLRCCVGEMVLVFLVAMVATLGVVGNLTVVAVMLRGGHRSEASSILRTSLSVADLLTSILVITPAVHDSISLMIGYKTSEMYWHEDFVDRVNIVHSEKRNNSSTYYEEFSYSDGWFQVIRGHMFCLCSVVSMVTMFVLSIERFIITKWPLRYKKYFTLAKVKQVIILSWILGVITLFILSQGKHVYWNSWIKISFGFAVEHIPSSKLFLGIFIALAIIGVCTVFHSVFSLYNFWKEQARVAAEWESMEMRVTGNFKKENLFITISLIIITILYLITVIPVGTSIAFEYNNRDEVRNPLLMFLSWLMLLAGSATNPIVYNMRSKQFKSDMAEYLQQILPTSLKRKMNPYITHSQKKLENYLRALDEEAAKAGNTRGHNGLPEGSKLAKLGLAFKEPSDP